jgi:serine phosphatase RsbU (regulator of sigma subunit)
MPPHPALFRTSDADAPSEAIGTRRGIRPVITEFPLQAGTTVVIFTDGMVHAGERTGEKLDILASMQTLLDCELPSAEFIAESLLDHALKLDRSRPVDDISLVIKHHG